MLLEKVYIGNKPAIFAVEEIDETESSANSQKNCIVSMPTGLEIIYNGKLIASAAPAENQWLLFGIQTLGSSVSFSLQRLGVAPGETVLHYAVMHPHDRICIKVKEIDVETAQLFDNDDYITFIQLEIYNHLHACLHNPPPPADDLGFEYTINGTTINVPLANQQKPGFAIVQNKKNGVKISIGADVRVSTTTTKHKSWAESYLSSGDEVTIAFKPVDQETPCTSEEEYASEAAVVKEKQIADYHSLRAELTEKGVLGR